jgi:hypothetical protein
MWLTMRLILLSLALIPIGPIFIFLIQPDQKSTSTSTATTIVFPPSGTLFFHSMDGIGNIKCLFQCSDSGTSTFSTTSRSVEQW